VQPKKQTTNNKESYLKQAAFLMFHCGMTEEQARSVGPELCKYIHDAWLEDKKFQEMLTARLCSLVWNFAQSFAKDPNFKTELDFMMIGKEPPKAAEFSEIVSIIKMATNEQSNRPTARASPECPVAVTPHGH